MKKRFFITMFSLIAILLTGGEIATAQYRSRPVPYNNRPARQSQTPSVYRDRADNSYMDYKGFIEVGYGAGLGSFRAHQVDILTTHGVSFDDWFIGVGTGVNLLFPNNNNLKSNSNWTSSSNRQYVNYQDNAVFIPLYVDFKYNFGDSRITPFIDLKVGATFLVSENGVYINDGWMENRSSLYLSPTIGFRVPIAGSAAFNFGVTYNLISQEYYSFNYWDGPTYVDGISLNSLGCRLSLEW